MPTGYHSSRFRGGRNCATAKRGEPSRDEPMMGKKGEGPILGPASRESLLALLSALSPIEDEFPEVDDPAPCELDS